MKRKVAALLLVTCVASATILIAGVLIPSMIRSESAQDSLETVSIGGVALAYKWENVCSAILGTSFGALVVLLLNSLPKSVRRESASDSIRTAYLGV